MNVKLISCWFATSYGAYSDGLRQALQRLMDSEVGVVTSNCGCGDPAEVRRDFQDLNCDYFESPHVPYYKSASPLKYRLRNAARQFVYGIRARRYRSRTEDADVVHFQQTLNAYGSVAVFNWLALPSKVARVVTVHELDPYQVDVPESNLAYNKADQIIVHAADLKHRLVEHGVDEGLINTVLHGVEIEPLDDRPRSGIIFYGGHKLHSGKGVDTLFQAMSIVKERLGPETPRLTIHGHWGDGIPEIGSRLEREHGLSDHVRWLNQIPLAEVKEEYRSALLCVLPFTGSFAGFAAANATANGLPVIATRRAGLPEHLGPAGRWVPEEDPQALADGILALLEDEAGRTELAAMGRSRAEAFLSWDTIAEQTLDVYRAAIGRAKSRASSEG